MAVLTTSLSLKSWICDLRFRSSNLVSPNRNRKIPGALSANVFRNALLPGVVAGARSFQKNHFYFRLGIPDQTLDLFDGPLDIVGKQIVSQLDVRIDQNLFRSQMHS